MADVTLLPYPNIGESITVTLECDVPAVHVDGNTVRYRQDSEHIQFPLKLSCLTPTDSLQALTKNGDLVSLILKRSSVTSRLRDRIVPTQGEPSTGAAIFEVSFDPDEQSGKINLVPQLVVEKSTNPEALGRVVGWGPTIVVELDPVARPLGNGLPVVWHSFEADDDLHDELLFSVRMDDPPTILLNSDIVGFRDVLSSQGTKGRRARIRDSVFGLLAHQVWTSLIAECLIDLTQSQSESPGLSLAEYTDAFPTWKRAVIRDWFPGLLELDGIGDPLPDELPSNILTERVPEMVQRRCRTPRLSFGGLYMEKSLDETGEDE